MKYIRTKDGVYEVEDEILITPYLDKGWEKVFKIVGSNECIKECNIINQADTIEELIDCLTKKEPKHKHPELLAGKPNMYLKDERALKYMTKRIKNKTIIISGCIWVGDDLIKISELNDKGELELI